MTGTPRQAGDHHPDLTQEFQALGPWVTRFQVDGGTFGGQYDATHDARLGQFFACFPHPSSILELGSLEGGHTFALAGQPGVGRLVAVEGRQANLDRARFVQRLLGMTNVEFVHADLDHFDLGSLGRFDAVFCVGVLYHLPRPWTLIDQLARASARLFIWTHYAEEAEAGDLVDGYRGVVHREWGVEDPLSGLAAESFWPTRASLCHMLSQAGFVSIQVVEDDPHHPNGPCVSLAASVP